MKTDLVIGLDSSTTTAKAIAWDRRGRALAEGRAGVAGAGEIVAPEEFRFRGLGPQCGEQGERTGDEGAAGDHARHCRGLFRGEQEPVLELAGGSDGAAAEPDAGFIAALDDDLNTPQALAVLFNLARDANRSNDPAERAGLAARLRASGALLGLLSTDPNAWFMAEVSDGLSAEQIETLLAARRAARANRDFKLADQIRDQLVEAGILIEDSAEGTRWRRSTG